MTITVKNILNWTQDSTLFGSGRIPAISASNSKVVIATGCRLGGGGDIVKGGGTKIGFMISSDKGASFTPLTHVIDLTSSGDAADDPCVLITNTGRIFVFATSTIGLTTTGASPFSSPGANIVRCYSDDDGVTWSPITAFDLPYDFNVVSCGNGTVTPDGTLLVPLYVTNSGAVWSVLILYSTDNGVTWLYKNKTPNTAVDNSESRVIYDDGAIYVLTRNGSSATNRTCWKSSDLGENWEEHKINALVDAGVNFGLINVDGVWFYSSPVLSGSKYKDATNDRAGGSILASKDKGQSWNTVLRLTPDDPMVPGYFFAYSCLAFDNVNRYCLYEGGSTTQRYSELNLAIF